MIIYRMPHLLFHFPRPQTLQSFLTPLICVLHPPWELSAAWSSEEKLTTLSHFHCYQPGLALSSFLAFQVFHNRYNLSLCIFLKIATEWFYYIASSNILNLCKLMFAPNFSRTFTCHPVKKPKYPNGGPLDLTWSAPPTITSLVIFTPRFPFGLSTPASWVFLLYIEFTACPCLQAFEQSILSSWNILLQDTHMAHTPSSFESPSVMSYCSWPQGLYSPWNSPGQNIGVGSLSFLLGIFPSQQLNPGLPHCRQILYQLSHKRSPRIPEWVAYPFSRGSSSSRNQTRVSCIASRFFTNWAMTLPVLCSLYPQNNTILFPCSHVPQS